MERIVIAVVTLGAFACLAAITLEDFGPEVLNKALWPLVTVVGAGLIALAITHRNGANPAIVSGNGCRFRPALP